MWTTTQSRVAVTPYFPALQAQSGASWDRQNPKQKLVTAVDELKAILQQKKEVEAENSKILELLNQEHNKFSLMSHYINSSDQKSLEAFLNLVKQRDKGGAFVNHVNSKAL